MKIPRLLEQKHVCYLMVVKATDQTVTIANHFTQFAILTNMYYLKYKSFVRCFLLQKY